LFKEPEGRASSDESSSDDEHTWGEEQRKELKKPTKKTDRQSNKTKPKFYEFKQAEDFKSLHSSNSLQNR
jgi:hypothetical protein